MVMNFILRTKFKEVILNRLMGDAYKVCSVSYTDDKTDKEWETELKKYFPMFDHDKGFKEEFRKFFPLHEDFKNITSLVVCEKTYIITKNMEAYIMTENGSIFENLNN